MKGSRVAKKLASSYEGFAQVSPAHPRCVFVVPINEVLLGFCVDRTSSAAENVLRPFAFPLAFGETGIVLDSAFAMHQTRFDPRNSDSFEVARELMVKHVAPWLSERGTLTRLLEKTPPPERGYSYSLNLHVYSRSVGPRLIDYVKLLCLAGRDDEARKLINEAVQDFRDHGSENSITEDDYSQLIALRKRALDADASERSSFWREAEGITVEALQLDVSYLKRLG